MICDADHTNATWWIPAGVPSRDKKIRSPGLACANGTRGPAWYWAREECGTLIPTRAKAYTTSPEQSNPRTTPPAPRVAPRASPPPHTYGTPNCEPAAANTDRTPAPPDPGPTGAALTVPAVTGAGAPPAAATITTATGVAPSTTDTAPANPARTPATRIRAPPSPRPEHHRHGLHRFELRTLAGLTQLGVATRAGLVRTTYSAIERGETPSLEEGTATRIATALGITAQQVHTAHAASRRQRRG
jgi:DNA-binding XRE family transcriptional regulator